MKFLISPSAVFASAKWYLIHLEKEMIFMAIFILVDLKFIKIGVI